MRRSAAWLALVAVLVPGGCQSAPPVPADPNRPAVTSAALGELSPRMTLEVERRLPHDPTAFTQGLEFHDGQLYESRGEYGSSAITRIDPETGATITSTPLPEDHFGEGLTVVGDQIWMLTWRAGVAYTFDRETLAETGQVSYDGEGWGLCDEPDRLVMSDGSDTLTFRDPSSFEVIGEVAVTRDGSPILNLNELECLDGLVLANVWQTDEILIIDPATGQVVTTIDASGLLSQADRQGLSDPRNAVLNGIAYDLDREVLLVTGKLWPAMFEVRLTPQ
ncbi:glutaminyl-peptide cyclotransferase [Parenemella sanctibonifatiensis]|uniref:Glutaminyl-peptide cyclotransferase n=1 Tax=Parenemella sanctibonifatiensis TaxID=2016505 RepID=A0A255ERH2_9ACTN|nr:glutaminyl-peptide cyclotransferase [Parenemella sanctibonifatiensis]OYN92195.1 glutaminyl-peptide cyclotransferase [Parenemella sanctibonifatiensis]